MNGELLQTSLDAMEIDLWNSTGLRFSFQDDSNSSAVLRFDVIQYIVGHDEPTDFPSSFSQVDGGWSFFVPALMMEPGDETKYTMSVLLGKEKVFFYVEGTLKIYIECPIVTGFSTELTQFCRTRPPVPGPQTQTSQGPPQTVKVGATVGTEGRATVGTEEGAMVGTERGATVDTEEGATVGTEEGATVGTEGGATVGTEGRATIDTEEGIFRWNHQFTINDTYKVGFTKTSVNKWLESTLSLKNQLEEDFDLYFGSTTGLMVAIADREARYCEGYLDTKIIAFNIKLNEEFKSLDPDQYGAKVTKTRYGWSYHYPGVTLKGGDKIFYWMRVVLGFYRWDTTVTGTLEVLQESPHTRGKPSHQKKAVISEESPHTIGPKGQSVHLCPTDSPVSGLQNPFQHRFVHPKKRKHHYAIQPTYTGRLTNESKTWWEEAQQSLEKILENTDFQFLSPTGLRFLIPGITGEDDGIAVLGFEIKLNEEFQSNDDDYYLSNTTNERVGHWRYYYPHLEFKEGDEVYYWMRVIFGTDKWDFIVRGMLEYKNITLVCPPPYHNAFSGSADPYLRVKGFKYNRAKVTPPTIVGDLSGGTVGEALRWSHRITITAAYDVPFTTSSAKNWLEDAKLLKSMLLQDFDIQLLNPVGLKISILGTNDFYLRATFGIQLNGAYLFRFRHAVDELSKYIIINEDLRFKAGDTMDYTMKVYLRNHVVSGKLNITGP